MYRIDNATAITVMPTPSAVGPKPNAFFTRGNPATSLAATIVDDDWANAVQEEICNVITGAGLTLDKTKQNQLLSAITGGRLGRTRLTANTTFYVNASTGNNSNDGLSSGTPWLTLQFAADYIQDKVDQAGFTATISIVGNFTAGMNFNRLIPGNGTFNPVTITTASTASIAAASGAALSVGASLNVTITGAITISAAAYVAIYSSNGANINTGAGLTMGTCATAHILADTGNVSVLGNYTISGNAPIHYSNGHGGIIGFGSSIVVTASGTRTFSTFAFVNQCGIIDVNSGAPVTFSGTFVGTRYSATVNGAFVGTGGNVNFFPGNAAGSTSSGGQYT